MREPPQSRSALRRALDEEGRADWWMHGLSEIVFGLALVASAVFFGIATLRPEWWESGRFWAPLIACVALGTPLLWVAYELAYQRVVAPRAGFMLARPGVIATQEAWMVGAGVLLFFVRAFLAGGLEVPDYVVWVALFVSALSLLTLTQIPLRRLEVLALASALLYLVSRVEPMPFPARAVVWTAPLGAASLAFGVGLFVRYLLDNPSRVVWPDALVSPDQLTRWKLAIWEGRREDAVEALLEAADSPKPRTRLLAARAAAMAASADRLGAAPLDVLVRLARDGSASVREEALQSMLEELLSYSIAPTQPARAAEGTREDVSRRVRAAGRDLLEVAEAVAAAGARPHERKEPPHDVP